MTRPSFASRMKLNGRNALVTGASGHIGQAVSNVLADLGANLTLVDINKEGLNTVKNSIEQRWDIKVKTYCFDLGVAGARENFLDSYMADNDHLSVLVNIAGFIGSSNLKGWSVPYENQDVNIWNDVLEVNLTSAFHLIQSLTPNLLTGIGPSVINFSSIYGFLGPDWRIYDGTDMANPAAYSVSKGGVIQLTRWLASTLAPRIRVNCVSPGGVLRGQPKSFLNKYVGRTPLGRMANNEDFDGVVAFLAGDTSSYITGQNFVVDGGWSIW